MSKKRLQARVTQGFCAIIATACIYLIGNGFMTGWFVRFRWRHGDPFWAERVADPVGFWFFMAAYVCILIYSIYAIWLNEHRIRTYMTYR